MIRISPIGKAMLITAIALLIAGIAVVALVVGFHAISCENTSLRDRNPQSVKYDAAVSDAFYVVSLQSRHRISAAAATKRFLHDAAVVHSVATYRRDHPLGLC